MDLESSQKCCVPELLPVPPHLNNSLNATTLPGLLGRALSFSAPVRLRKARLTAAFSPLRVDNMKIKEFIQWRG